MCQGGDFTAENGTITIILTRNVKIIIRISQELEVNRYMEKSSMMKAFQSSIRNPSYCQWCVLMAY